MFYAIYKAMVKLGTTCGNRAVRRTHCGFVLENLESRDVPATVSLVGTQLQIIGDASNERVEVSTRNLNGVANVSVWINGQGLGNFLASRVRTIRFDGNDGNDAFKFRDGTAVPCILRGGAGNDTLVGGAGNDTICGDSGNDVIRGEQGNDCIDGGVGNDVLHGNSGNDCICGSAGDDQVYGDSGNDCLYGNDGNDTLAGGSGSDGLFGGNGNDLLYGADITPAIYHNDGSRDELSGGAGADTFYLSYDSLDVAVDYVASHGDRKK